MRKTKDFDFKVNILKYFWNNRDGKIIPKLNGLMKQKYLFFYNMFAKVNNKPYTLNQLKAFKNGPIYYDIYTETKNGTLLEQTITENTNIDKKIADNTLILMYLYRNNVSTLTHTLDLWNNTYNSTNNNINEESISKNDVFKLEMLYNELDTINQKYEIYFNKNDIPLLFIKNQKNPIINNNKDLIESYNNADKLPTYVYLDNGEVYFD